MRRSNALAIVVGLLAVISVLGAAPAMGAELAGGPVLNVGHRGTAGLAPEHTIASYDRALEDGADYIEQDLRITSDGVLVVLRDEDLDRTTRGPAENCTGPVSEKTLAQVKTCDVGSFFNERYPEYAREEYEGLEIPTLEEVFQRYGTETNYYTETRSAQAPGQPRYGRQLGHGGGAAAVDGPVRPKRARRRELAGPCPILRPREPRGDPRGRSRAAAGAALLGRGVGRSHSSGPRRGRILRGRDGPSMDDVDRGLVESAHARCLAVHPYTLAERPDMRGLVDFEVDGMFADFPNRLEEVLGEEAADANRAAEAAAEASRTCGTEAGPAEVPDAGGVPMLLPSTLGALLLSVCLLVAGLRRA